MASYTLTHNETIYIKDCCNCGMPFGMTDDYRRRMKEKGATFYCPQGHPQHYTESDIQKLRKQLETKDRDLANARDNLRVEAASRLQAQEQLRKVKKRVNAGVCPYCKRSFVALQRHVHTKHPGEVHSG